MFVCNVPLHLFDDSFCVLVILVFLCLFGVVLDVLHNLRNALLFVKFLLLDYILRLQNLLLLRLFESLYHLLNVSRVSA